MLTEGNAQEASNGPTNAQDKPLPVEIHDAVMSACFFVFVVWIFAVYSPRGLFLSGENLDARASSVEALFSGLAFIGVVAALFYQREDLRLQRKELELTRQELGRSAEAQEQSARQSRISSERQSREQFLTARLNATTALLQSLQAKASYIPGENRYDVFLGRRQVIQLSHQVGILLCEAEQGFGEECADFGTIRSLSLSQYVKTYFRGLYNRCKLPPGNMTRLEPRSMAAEQLEMQLLCEQIRPEHEILAQLIEQRMGHLSTLKTTEEAEAYLRQFAHFS